MARAPKKQRVRGPASSPANAANAPKATKEGGGRRSFKKLARPAVDPAEAAIKAAEAAPLSAQEKEKAAAAAAAAKAKAASAALKSARRARRAERQCEKRATAAASVSATMKDAVGADSPYRGVIFIGHLPHGFYEEELRGFFSQFGTVLRVRVARSRKTARAKGYAWVQFANDAVARIAAETMNGYLLFGRLLHVNLVPVNRQHTKMWFSANRTWRKIPWRAVERQRHNEVDPMLAAVRRTARLLVRAQAASKKLAAVGVQYDAPAPIGPVPLPQ